MDLIFLAGESERNKEWVEEIGKELKPLFDKTKIQYYRHWGTGEGRIDLDFELGVLLENIKDFREYAVFAKSAGVILALRGVFERKINPVRCIFLGTPIGYSKRLGLDIEKWLKDYRIPTLFIQKEFDPVCNYKDLEKVLGELEIKNHKLIKIPGDDHYYGDLEGIRLLVEDFILKK